LIDRTCGKRTQSLRNPPQKIHNPQHTKPNHPRQHLPPKSFLRRVDHATKMRGGGENVKSPSSQPLRRATDQALCSGIQAAEMTEQRFLCAGGFSEKNHQDYPLTVPIQIAKIFLQSYED
jgi:hypothetical protein